MKSRDHLMEVTEQACALIREQFPDNSYIVSIFQENDNGTTGQSFRGRMDNESLIGLANATINQLAENTGKTRMQIFGVLMTQGDPVTKVVDYHLQNHKEAQDD